MSNVIDFPLNEMSLPCQCCGNTKIYGRSMKLITGYQMICFDCHMSEIKAIFDVTTTFLDETCKKFGVE
jgi:hypothetical protein